MPVRIVDRFEEFRNLGRDWDLLIESSPLDSVFLTHDWFSAWWSNLGIGGTLHVLLVEDDGGRLIGAAPLWLSEGGLHSLAGEEVSDYFDLIYRTDRADEFFPRLLEWMSDPSQGYQGIELLNVPASSRTPAAVAAWADSKSLACRVSEVEVAPVLELPSTYEEYLSGLGRKARHELKRKLRRMRSMGEIEFESVRRPERAIAAADEFIDFHRASSPEKQRFWLTPGMETFFRDMAARFSGRGWLTIDRLAAGGVLAASLMSFQYRDEVSLYNVAFSALFSAFSPGYSLFDRAIRRAIEEGRRKVDFLRGGEKYKYDFGAQDGKILKIELKLRADPK